MMMRASMSKLHIEQPAIFQGFYMFVYLRKAVTNSTMSHSVIVKKGVKTKVYVNIFSCVCWQKKVI